jgi:hypothetical protein
LGEQYCGFGDNLSLRNRPWMRNGSLANTESSTPASKLRIQRPQATEQGVHSNWAKRNLLLKPDDFFPRQEAYYLA